MVNVITLATLTAPSTELRVADRGTFKAETLTLTITSPDGTVVAECEMEPRAFKPSEKTGRGGCGWYADVKARDANYRGIPCSGGFRVSLAGLKIGAGDVVDLTPDDS